MQNFIWTECKQCNRRVYRHINNLDNIQCIMCQSPPPPHAIMTGIKAKDIETITQQAYQNKLKALESIANNNTAKPVPITIQQDLFQK